MTKGHINAALVIAHAVINARLHHARGRQGDADACAIALPEFTLKPASAELARVVEEVPRKKVIEGKTQFALGRDLVLAAETVAVIAAQQIRAAELVAVEVAGIAPGVIAKHVAGENQGAQGAV